MKTIKKIFIILVVIAVAIFISDRVYQFYSRNNINSHESIILINEEFSEQEIDAFFNLKEGTYDPEKQKIVYSLMKKDGYLLDNYINLPTKHKNRNIVNQFECNVKYSEVRPYAFYNYEIDSKNVIARIITNDANPVKILNSKEVVSEKQLSINFEYGKINIYNIGRNGITKFCE